MSSTVTPKRLPNRMWERFTWLGTLEMSTVPKENRVVNTMPMEVSERMIRFFLTAPMRTTARSADTSAPTT